MGKIIINTKNFKIEIEDLEIEQEQQQERIVIKKPKSDRVGKPKIIKEYDEEERPKQKKGDAIGILHNRVKLYLLEHPEAGYRETMKLIGEQMRNENK